MSAQDFPGEDCSIPRLLQKLEHTFFSAVTTALAKMRISKTLDIAIILLQYYSEVTVQIVSSLTFLYLGIGVLLCYLFHIRLISIGKTCSVRILQLINNPKEWCNNQSRAEVFITPFLRVVYSLKYPSDACLSCLDNSYSCWNVVGVLPVSRYLTKIKHSNIFQISKYC